MQSSLSRFLAVLVAGAALFASGAALAQKVRLATTAGDIVVELDPAKAPKSVANFQGGGMTADMKEKETRAPIPLESRNGLLNQRGTVAMARTPDPNSATAQFFINVKDNDFLNQAQAKDGNGYAVFGKVIQGMDVVDKIKDTPTGPGDVPAQPIVIKKATVEK